MPDDLGRGPAKAAFFDGNEERVEPPDEVQYRVGARHGELIEVFSDGNALVRFFDNWGSTEDVNWHHLCKVPERFRISPPSPSASDTNQGER